MNVALYLQLQDSATLNTGCYIAVFQQYQELQGFCCSESTMNTAFQYVFLNIQAVFI
jgi:hypothetical protein